MKKIDVTLCVKFSNSHPIKIDFIGTYSNFQLFVSMENCLLRIKVSAWLQIEVLNQKFNRIT